MPNLKDLHCFVLAYELHSFSRAADILDTVQSLISARIHRLERFFDAPLFLRMHHGVMPTPAGDLLYPRAKRVVCEVAEMESAVKLCDAERQPPRPYKGNRSE